MKSRRSPLAAAAALAFVFISMSFSVTSRTRAAAAQTNDARQQRVQAAVARVFDTSVLHRIEIVIAPADARTILNRMSERVRSTFTFDGIVLKEIGRASSRERGKKRE